VALTQTHLTRHRAIEFKKFLQTMWTFTRLPGVPATNNTSERALRHAVMCARPASAPRPTTATASSSGSSRSRETCRLQGRRLHQYLTAAITANLHGQPTPALLTPT
jgi:hypothetical protein